MDNIFYTIEKDGDKKVVHILGNVYWNDADTTEKNYRLAEWTGMYFTIFALRRMIENNMFYEHLDERVNYLEDINRDEAYKICDTYFNGTSGKYLPLKDVNEYIPCGDYWC